MRNTFLWFQLNASPGVAMGWKVRAPLAAHASEA
jgi:hypothetical protein